MPCRPRFEPAAPARLGQWDETERYSISGIERGAAFDSLPKPSFLIGHFAGYGDASLDNQIARGAVSLWQSAATNPQFLSGLRAGWDPNVHIAIERRHTDFSAQH